MIDMPLIDVDVIEPACECSASQTVQHGLSAEPSRDLQVEAQGTQLEILVSGNVLGSDDRTARAMIVVAEP